MLKQPHTSERNSVITSNKLNNSNIQFSFRMDITLFDIE